MGRRQLDTFPQCFDSWATWKNKGYDILSSFDQENPAVKKAIEEVKDNLHQILVRLHQLLQELPETSRGDFLQDVGMYEQEYMLKETILTLYCESGAKSKQHLVGNKALWKADIFIKH